MKKFTTDGHIIYLDGVAFATLAQHRDENNKAHFGAWEVDALRHYLIDTLNAESDFEDYKEEYYRR